MRKPPKPPIPDYPTDREGFERLTSPEVFDIVRRVNSQYLYWDRVRHLPMPEGITPELVWTAVKLHRMGELRALPLWLYTENDSMRFWTPSRHQQWLHRIDQMAGGTIGTMSGNAIPDDNERYLFNSLMEEAIASSRLEGASSTREKAKKMLRSNRKARNRSEQMILNNYAAIRQIRELKDEELTPEMLLQLQELLTIDTLDDPNDVGQFRSRDDKVQVVESLTDEVMHDPPDAASIQPRLEQLCDFANSKEGEFIHPVVRAIVLHFAIGFIHPFVDGNGRTARAVFYWYMLKNKYWLFEYLPISRILIREPIKYEKAYLYSELDWGDVTYFIHFHLGLIVQAIDALHGYISRQLRLVKETSKIVRRFPDLNHRQTSLIQDCLMHPGKRYTIRQHVGTHRIAYGTARSDLLGLKQRKLLVGEKVGKKYVFYAPDNLMERIRCTPKKKLVDVDTEPANESKADDSTEMLF